MLQTDSLGIRRASSNLLDTMQLHPLTPLGPKLPDDLSLVAMGPATSRAASAPTSGRVVTLEELAQLVRRRKPRPRPAREEQLALFGT